MFAQKTDTKYYVNKSFTILKVDTPQKVIIYQQTEWFDENNYSVSSVVRLPNKYFIKRYLEGNCTFSILDRQHKILTTRYYKLASQIIK